MLCNKRIAVAAAGCLLCVVSSANADITAVNGVTGGTNKSAFNGSVGFNFTVGNNPISVTALGYYAPFSPSGASNQVGIYTGSITSSDTLLGSATIVSTSTTSTPGWFFQTLDTPITLDANTTYSIVGADNSGTAVTTYNGHYLTNATGSVTYGSDLTFNVMVYGAHSGSGLVAPSNTYPGNNPGSFNPNFQYTVTPEPASLGLLATGAIGLIARRRRD